MPAVVAVAWLVFVDRVVFVARLVAGLVPAVMGLVFVATLVAGLVFVEQHSKEGKSSWFRSWLPAQLVAELVFDFLKVVSRASQQ